MQRKSRWSRCLNPSRAFCAGSFLERPSSVIVRMILLILALLSIPSPTGAAPPPAPAIAAPRPGQDASQLLKVLRISPAGEDVPAGREITFQFDRPVVPLGRMERSASEIPITMEPPVACQWRWLSVSSLACRMEAKAALRPATRYRITVGAGMKAEDGSSLGKEVTHAFLTERPKVSSNWFKTWMSPGTPQIGVQFNQRVMEATVAGHLYFLTQRGVRIGAKTAVDPDAGGESAKESPTPPPAGKKGQAGRSWLLTPKQELPLDEEIQLRLEPGVMSVEGPEASAKEQTVASFQTFPAFRFAGIQCTSNHGDPVTIPPEGAGRIRQRCNPSQTVSLAFASPVMKDDISGALRTVPGLETGSQEEDPWANVYTSSQLQEPHQKGKVYTVPLPEGALKPFTEYRAQAAPFSVKDEFGRKLAQPIEIHFATDHLLPDFEIVKHWPVFEKGLDTDMPLLSTNLTHAELKYESLTTQGRSRQGTRVLKVPKVQDAVVAVPLGIREIIPAPSGLVQGNLTTQPPVPDKKSEASFLAQVTPFHVHAKFGHRNLLVWVTDLQSGAPVADVDVQVYKDTFNGFSRNPPILARAKTDQNGLAELPGAARLDPELHLIQSYEPKQPHLFIRCLKADDMAVLPVKYDFEVSAEGSNHDYIPAWTRPLHGHIRTWGATAQGIYKVGDTVQYKIYVRDQDNRRFVPAPASDYRLKVMDPVDKVVHEREGIELSSFGAFDGELSIPRNGAVGWYRFVLTSSFSKEEWESMRVLVSDFTPAPFQVTTDIDGKIFGFGDKVTTTTLARLHAGGPYTNAPVRLTALVEARPFVPSDPKAKGFQFDVIRRSRYRTPESISLHQTNGKLDDTGSFRNTFEITGTPIVYGRLTVESAVRDDRGKSTASSASAVFVGRERYVGLSQGDWTLEQGKPARIRMLVVDRNGHPAAGTPVLITVKHRQTKAARVKGAGDAYLTQYADVWVKTQKLELVSTPDPQEFEITPDRPGTYKITASILDPASPGGNDGSTAPDPSASAASDGEEESSSDGEEDDLPPGQGHETTLHRYVVGQGHVVWESIPGNLLDVNGEKEEYKVGETARFFVQNPFPGAWGLVAVERFGVLQSWVRQFTGSTEVIEIPILPDYLPGIYVSVMVMSPRVEKPVSPDGTDLGKPTFRMGYVKVPVNDPYKEIAVDIKSGREVYKPGDTVTLDLQATPRNLSPGASRPPIELAVAVLDDSVFDLLSKGREAFDPYRGFYRLDDLDLVNYNLVMHLIGREKIEKKGANPGGGGGPDLGLRSLFKFLSYWSPSLAVDAQGKARIQFKAPDNLTGWRVLVMAATPGDCMGLGESVFRVNQSTEIRPVMPNQVMEGDSFEAGISVMNRTDSPRTLEVSLEASGPVEALGLPRIEGAGANAPPTPSSPLGLKPPPLSVPAVPFQRTAIRFPLKATGPGEIVLVARAGDPLDKDAMKHSLRALVRQSPVTVATHGSMTHGSTTGPEAVQPIAFPKDMRAGTGRLTVSLSPSIVGGMDGAFELVRNYPFTCWEQQITRAVMAAWYQRLKPHMSGPFAWEDSTRIPAKMLALAAEHQAPNGGMAYYLPKDEYVDPYLSVYTALAFTWLRAEGHPPPGQVEARLQEYLRGMLKKDPSPGFYTANMAWTVRAAALAALAGRSKIERSDLDRCAPHVPEMSLLGKALYLEALLHAPGTEAMRRDVVARILAQSEETGGTITFNQRLDGRYAQMLTSPIRDNCAVLSGLLAYQAATPSDTSLGDIPARLARTIVLGRKNKPGWASTQENVFAIKALTDFSRAFEQQPPRMRVHAWLDKEPLGEAVFQDFADPSASLVYPIRPRDPGRKADVRIQRTGDGRAYYSTSLTYTPAHLKEEPVNAGIEVQREYSVERQGEWVQLQGASASLPMRIRTGEIVRVDLFVTVPAARCFVVLEDPVPGGLEPINRQLATTSAVDSAKAGDRLPAGSVYHRFTDWMEYALSRWSFYHKELRHDTARFYSELLGPGRYHLSYAAQAVAPGEFTALPSRAEEMYHPDVFGTGLPGVFHVTAGE